MGRQQADRKPNSTISAVSRNLTSYSGSLRCMKFRYGLRVESAMLGEFTFKLFHRVYEANPASGVRTPTSFPAFRASNLLCELIEAYRALDWPRISVLVHGTYSENEGHGSEPRANAGAPYLSALSNKYSFSATGLAPPQSLEIWAADQNTACYQLCANIAGVVP